MGTIVLDPVTRIEGHLRIDTRVQSGTVTEAWSRGEMFRGFEVFLSGRDPFDAPVITQRICGVCPVSHAVAACRAVESALDISVPRNGQLLRSLVLGANYLQSHVLHFYQLSALDFVNVAALLEYDGNDPVLRELKAWAQGEVSSGKILPAAPFLPQMPGQYSSDPRWNLAALSHYVEALEVRQEAHQMAALFGGKMPHTAALIPGGVTTGVEPEAVEDCRTRLRRVRRFIENVYLGDVLAAARLFPEYGSIGGGVQRFLSYGVFEEGDRDWLPSGVVEVGKLSPLDTRRISEQVGSSKYAGGGGQHPLQGETRPEPHKSGAYSWLKAPRYGGAAYEVGPLARMVVAAAAGHPEVTATLSGFLADTGLEQKVLFSVLGRHAARALEALLVAQRMETWLERLEVGAVSVGTYTPRPGGDGEGLTEAPRGALGHWTQVRDGKIARYQAVVPSTWNFSPRGDRSDPGPVETALLGTPVDEQGQGLEVARVVRSFDPCIACAVH
ncbi:MAG TPA: nickel-dependent hydrogenase large subunit [Deferrisomatales bacterium]|nr:nickel-dependent hydrogenase large subunit [Deferrisomatales bacterium]